MPLLNNTNMRPGGVITPVDNTLTASDTIAWDQNVAGALLVLRNPTAGALSLSIAGSQSTTVTVPGVGSVPVNPLAVGSIPVGATRVIALDSRREFLQGTITITGGVGLIAQVLTF